MGVKSRGDAEPQRLAQTRYYRQLHHYNRMSDYDILFTGLIPITLTTHYCTSSANNSRSRTETSFMHRREALTHVLIQRVSRTQGIDCPSVSCSFSTITVTLARIIGAPGNLHLTVLVPLTRPILSLRVLSVALAWTESTPKIVATPLVKPLGFASALLCHGGIRRIDTPNPVFPRCPPRLVCSVMVNPVSYPTRFRPISKFEPSRYLSCHFADNQTAGFPRFSPDPEGKCTKALMFQLSPGFTSECANQDLHLSYPIME